MTIHDNLPDYVVMLSTKQNVKEKTLLARGSHQVHLSTVAC